MRSFPFSLILLCLIALLGCPSEEPSDDDDTTSTAVDPPRLKVTHDPIELSELAIEAVAIAPAWVRDDLVIALAPLGEDLQNELATILLDLDDHYLIDDGGLGDGLGRALRRRDLDRGPGPLDERFRIPPGEVMLLAVRP